MKRPRSMTLKIRVSSFVRSTLHLPMPQISTNEIHSMNKADELARAVTFLQIAWFSLTCAGCGVARIGLSPLKLTTPAYILCALHTFFFWHYKLLDPSYPLELLQFRRCVAIWALKSLSHRRRSISSSLRQTRGA
jgi:hypothetical protein